MITARGVRRYCGEAYGDGTDRRLGGRSMITQVSQNERPVMRDSTLSASPQGADRGRCGGFEAADL